MLHLLLMMELVLLVLLVLVVGHVLRVPVVAVVLQQGRGRQVRLVQAPVH